MRWQSGLVASQMVFLLGISFGWAEDGSEQSTVLAPPIDVTAEYPVEVSCEMSESAAVPVDETAEIPIDDKGFGSHRITVAPWAADKTIRTVLYTSAGEVVCDLFAGTHPMTTLNFISLATGKPAWTDGSGQSHADPYYSELKFGAHQKGVYVVSGERPEGTDFVLPDERCEEHQPVAGSIVMVQAHPGQASTQFMLIPKENPRFKGMYIVFGQCGPLDIIDKLTHGGAILNRVDVVRN